MSKVLITLTGPSGVGKSYLKKYLRKVFNLTEPPVYTTREKRGNENCSDRIYLTKKEFRAKLKNKELILVNEIYGNYYGFHKNAFLNNSNQITEIYVDNVKKIKEICPSVLMLGLLPENLDFLMYRLQKRKKESGEKVPERSEGTKAELNKVLKQKEYFDYLYYVGKNNEGKICSDIENYIKNYYQLF